MPANRWISLIDLVERASHRVDARACVCSCVNGDEVVSAYACDNGHACWAAFRARDVFARHAVLGEACDYLVVECDAILMHGIRKMTVCIRCRHDFMSHYAEHVKPHLLSALRIEQVLYSGVQFHCRSLALGRNAAQ